MYTVDTALASDALKPKPKPKRKADRPPTNDPETAGEIDASPSHRPKRARRSIGGPTTPEKPPRGARAHKKFDGVVLGRNRRLSRHISSPPEVPQLSDDEADRTPDAADVAAGEEGDHFLTFEGAEGD